MGGALVAVLLLVRSGQAAARAARLESDLEAARRTTDEQRVALTASQTQLRDAFTALSRDALKENRQDFLQNADAVLRPVRETLERVQAQLVDVDKHREGTFRAVSTQLASLMTAQEQLRQTTEGLSRSLRSPNVRGRWGEIQLRRIVELAGMLEQCDFIEKESVDDRGRRPPDARSGRQAPRRHQHRRRLESADRRVPVGDEREERRANAKICSPHTPDRSAITCAASASRSTGSSFSRRPSSS